MLFQRIAERLHVVFRLISPFTAIRSPALGAIPVIFPRRIDPAFRTDQAAVPNDFAPTFRNLLNLALNVFR